MVQGDRHEIPVDGDDASAVALPAFGVGVVLVVVVVQTVVIEVVHRRHLLPLRFPEKPPRR
jgi:hypothetical protein